MDAVLLNEDQIETLDAPDRQIKKSEYAFLLRQQADEMRMTMQALGHLGCFVTIEGNNNSCGGGSIDVEVFDKMSY